MAAVFSHYYDPAYVMAVIGGSGLGDILSENAKIGRSVLFDKEWVGDNEFVLPRSSSL
jgi:hypothetical protein